MHLEEMEEADDSDDDDDDAIDAVVSFFIIGTVGGKIKLVGLIRQASG